MQRFALAGLCIAAASVSQVALGAPLSPLPGASLSPIWMVPFIGILLSIALVPLTAPRFWHQHFGKTSAFWALAFLVPFAGVFGVQLAFHEVMATLLHEYIPFMVLLLALYTVAGGIHVKGNLHGSPLLNTGLLALGTVLASLMGTTGAAMLLIRPLIRANDNRRHNAHVVIFFIFLVANIGGALTPLGDPPLFLGFLQGVDFFWTTQAMLAPTLTASAVLLAVFFIIDTWFFRRSNERRPASRDPTPDSRLAIQGKRNLVLLLAILGSVVLSGTWQPNLEIHVFNVPLELQNVMRDMTLLAIAWLSWRITPRHVRQAHHFEWGPIIEVAKLFAAIFLTIIPAIAMLRAGDSGVLRPLVDFVTTPDGVPDNVRYFWLTGALSSFLDNAPTYLVFFNMAGSDAAMLMGPLATTLVAISGGAVFMGAMTYIGNAPNFMVKSIAERRGIRMPSFLGYTAWSCGILLPVFALITALFFAG
ncbi:MAG TPA: sodium:proton antiporter [Burkholderiales bacterium]|nr:sodium:proton antiporter [Burkholderiales bacterium]